jgi:molecular chaperone HscB
LSTVSTDYFQALGLPRKLQLDTAQLEQRRRELSRQYHPDRFATKSLEEQRFATDMTSLVNDAYRTLKDPITRAEYVLRQAGLDIAEQTKVPQELLEEVFELNMALEELRQGDQDARQQIESAGQQFQQMLQNITQQLNSLFSAYDADDDSALGRMRNLLNRRRYVQNLMEEVERTLLGAAPPL